jgi:hypothetical protein
LFVHAAILSIKTAFNLVKIHLLFRIIPLIQWNVKFLSKKLYPDPHVSTISTGSVDTILLSRELHAKWLGFDVSNWYVITENKSEWSNEWYKNSMSCSSNVWISFERPSCLTRSSSIISIKMNMFGQWVDTSVNTDTVCVWY